MKRLVLHKASTPDLSFGLRGHIDLLLDNVSIGKVPVYAEGSKLPEAPEACKDQERCGTHRFLVALAVCRRSASASVQGRT